MTLLEDEIAELADPELHEQIRLTPEQQRQLEADAEAEGWNLCVRCGGKDHYAKDCGERPAACPDFPMPRKGQA